MSVALNHTSVHTPEHRRAAEELAELLGVAPPHEFGPFWVLDLANDGGRGVYWADPDGHWLEIITVPYGGFPGEG